MGRWDALRARLAPLHQKLGAPRAGDWLASRSEPGQTFDAYTRCAPVRPRGRRKVLYIQPVGAMSGSQHRIVKQTARFMAAYFQLSTKVLKPLGIEVVPRSARRSSRGFGTQLLTSHLRNQVLRPRLPKDAAAMIAFTALDLWPGKGWNFVFGEASLRQRVAVWSLARNGDPEAGADAYRLCLLRTLKTATHETGHMFSVQHCTAYECNMCGSMSQEESDRHPLALCPECVCKICWGCGAEPVERYSKLRALASEFDLTAEAERYQELAQALVR